MEKQADDTKSEIMVSNNLVWDESTETLLGEIADKALCYCWLHDKAYRQFKKNNQKLAIPGIILSTLIGAVTVSIGSYVPTSLLAYTQAGIGGISIFNGILSTLNTYYKFAELSQDHLNASNGWFKLYKNISIELKLARAYRKDINVFYRDCRKDYDRLSEGGLVIPHDIVSKFEARFRKNHQLHKPEIGNRLVHTEAYVDGIDLQAAKQEAIMHDAEFSHSSEISDDTNSEREHNPMDLMNEIDAMVHRQQEIERERKIIREKQEIIMRKFGAVPIPVKTGPGQNTSTQSHHRRFNSRAANVFDSDLEPTQQREPLPPFVIKNEPPKKMPTPTKTFVRGMVQQLSSILNLQPQPEIKDYEMVEIPMPKFHAEEKSENENIDIPQDVQTKENA